MLLIGEEPNYTCIKENIIMKTIIIEVIHSKKIPYSNIIRVIL